MISLRYGIQKKAKCIETEIESGGYQGLGQWGNGEMLTKVYKLPVIRLTSSVDVMYSMMTIITENTVLYAFESYY